MKKNENKKVQNEVTNILSENFSFAEIMKQVKEETQGLIKTSLGRSETSIYKKQMFEGMNEKQIKSTRKKIRNWTFSNLEAICNNPTNEKLINAFVKFYKATYLLNDYSFASLASENTKENKKATLIKGLEIVKSFINK